MVLPCVDFGVQSNTKYDFNYNMISYFLQFCHRQHRWSGVRVISGSYWMCLFRMSVCHKGNFISFILYIFFSFSLKFMILIIAGFWLMKLTKAFHK